MDPDLRPVLALALIAAAVFGLARAWVALTHDADPAPDAGEALDEFFTEETKR